MAVKTIDTNVKQQQPQQGRETRQEMAPSQRQEVSGAETTRPGRVFEPDVDIFETEDGITVLAERGRLLLHVHATRGEGEGAAHGEELQSEVHGRTPGWCG